MKFWPFPLIRTYKTSRDASAVFQRFIDAPDLCVLEKSEYWTTVSCSLGKLRFWSAGEYYAYGSKGAAESHTSSKSFGWWDVMPSRLVVRRMAKRINQLSAPASVAEFFGDA